MNILESVNIFFLLEFAVVLIIVLLFLLLRFNKEKSNAQKAANDFINKLEETSAIRDKQLARTINDHCTVDGEFSREIMQTIKANEQRLYQKIVELFLLRDAQQLNNMDAYVVELTKPYNTLLTRSTLNESSGQLSPERVAEQARIQALEAMTEKLGTQLNSAMKTMDEVSGEYTRIFNGSKSETELDSSCKKMLSIYQQAQREAGKLLAKE